MSDKYNVSICYDGRLRTVGFVQGDTLYCARILQKHLFRCGRETVKEALMEGVAAWGLDCLVCDALIERNVVWLEISANNATYTCKLEELSENGFVLDIKPHRKQYFLNLRYFVIKRGTSL